MKDNRLLSLTETLAYITDKTFRISFDIHHSGSRDSVVGIATGYGLDDRGVRFRVPVGSRIFSTSSRPALGPTQPPIQYAPGTLSTAVKRQRREADHSPPASAEVKKTWIYTASLPYAFMV
jgi:hypothetical protein